MKHLTRRKFVGLAAALAVLAVVLPQGGRAQSTNKANPTPLRSREVRGRAYYSIPSSGWAKTFYYAFEAGPGEVEATVTTGPSETGVHYNVSFEEAGGAKLQSLGLIAPTAKDERLVSKSFSLARRARVIMAVRLSGRFDYTISLGGAVAVIGEMGSQPVIGEDSSRPIVGDKRRRPIIGEEGSQPIIGEEGSRPIIGEEGSRPIIGEMGRRPAAGSVSRSSPTLITTREISGRADYPVPSSGWARTFYYAFEAGPGEVTVTVVTQPSDTGVRYNVSFEEGGRKLPSVGLIAPIARDEREVSKSFTLSRQTRVLMIVRLSGRFDYTIKLDGVVAPDM